MNQSGAMIKHAATNLCQASCQTRENVLSHAWWGKTGRLRKSGKIWKPVPSHAEQTGSERGKTLNPAPNFDGKRGNHATGAKRGNLDQRLNYRARTFFTFYLICFLIAKSEAKAAARREAIKEAAKRDQK